MSDKEKQLEKMRHSASHVLAQAVLRIFPDGKLGIGPATGDGFYYDFKLDRTLKPKDLKKIQEEMQKIKKDNLPIEKQEMKKDQALKFFKNQKQTFKIELINDLSEEEKITVYKQGDFVDLCGGPHVKSTGKIGKFKLTSIAGAYWKGSEKNPQLQRIYGTTFETKKELKNHLERLEKAKESDHRKLGKKLDLYSISEDIGPGLILWHPKGSIVRSIIEDFWKKEHTKRGYQLVYTPHIARVSVWKKSGHLDYFSDNMFSPFGVDKDQYLIKPMNCPFHIEIYNSKMHSYKDLPIRIGELGTVYRYEKSGVLHGLTRVRSFTQDDAHIFCTKDQMKDELLEIINLTKFMLREFGLKKQQVFLSTRPKNFVGEKETWKEAEKALEVALKESKTEYKVDKGEGAFYGPKIDFKIEDSLGNLWQGPTIQLDFVESEKFDLSYIDNKNKKQQPIMIHRTVLGSMERFMGLLIENYSGAFPFWLAPVQIGIVPVSEKHNKYAQKIKSRLVDDSIRVEIDSRSESVNKKIRDFELVKVPYVIVVGDRELKSSKIAVRSRGKKAIEEFNLEDFIKEVK